MSDLVDRLRGLRAQLTMYRGRTEQAAILNAAGFTEGASEAADEIERLKAECCRLRDEADDAYREGCNEAYREGWNDALNGEQR